MSQIMSFIHVIMHIDQYLNTWSIALGPWLYVIMFLVIFAETGLVIFPFLPGDSLLFALGAMTSIDQNPLNIWILSLALMSASILGDNTNHFIGQIFGKKLFTKEKSIFFKKSNLIKAEKFYDKYGSKAVVIGRFVPIIRTLVPFVAGIGQMKRKKFFSYSVIGAIIWVNILLFAGRFFGNLPIVKANFQLVIVGVIILSYMPIVYEFAVAKLRKSQ
jgi:membrane-associated protein